MKIFSELELQSISQMEVRDGQRGNRERANSQKTSASKSILQKIRLYMPTYSNFVILCGILVCVRSILLYQRFKDGNCSGEPYFEYANDIYFIPGVDYCSNFFHRSNPKTFSIGFTNMNSTHMKVIEYGDNNCNAAYGEILIAVIRVDSCEVDVTGNGVYDPVLGYSIFTEVGSFPSQLSAELSNEGTSVRADMYGDYTCLNKSKYSEWDSALFPMNTTSEVFFPFTSQLYNGLTYSYFTYQVVRKKCNDSHILQYFIDEATNKIVLEISLHRLDLLDSCYISYHDLDTGTMRNSYKYTCTNDDFDSFSASGASIYQTAHNFWNQICYGSPYRVVEAINGFCRCVAYQNMYLCYMEYVIDGQRTLIYQIVDTYGCRNISGKDDLFRLSFDMTAHSGVDTDCFSSNENTYTCGFSEEDGLDFLNCYVTLLESNDRFQEPSYFIYLDHYENCTYLRANPTIWEDLKREFNPVSGYSVYFHDTTCISEISVGFSPLEKYQSAYGACTEDGEFYLTLYNNSLLCDEKKRFDESIEVTVTVLYGDYCAYDPSEGELSHMTLTCDTLYCNSIPKYLKNVVCSGNGVCLLDMKEFQSTNIRQGLCSCNQGYGGINCEIPDDEVSGDVSGGTDTLTTVIIVSSIFVPLILIVCSTFICCLIILCNIFCCIVSSLGCCAFGITGITIRQKMRLDSYGELKHFDILLQEQKLDSDETIAHLKINDDLFEIPYDEIRTISILGEGGSNSVVFKAKWDGLDVAFKCFKTRHIANSQHRFDEFEREVEILASVSHPNIIRFYGATMKVPRIGIVMEFVCNGEILDYIINFREKSGSSYPLFQKMRMIEQVVMAMVFLHSRSIIHRDIKSENVLIDEKENTKLMDFGLSRLVKSNSTAKTMRVGTNVYMAPEIVTSESYTEKCDVYSFSILVYIVLTEKVDPYDHTDSNQIEIRVANDPAFRPNLDDLNCLDKDHLEWIREMIVKCWDSSPGVRYSFKEIRELLGEKRDSLKVFDENEMIGKQDNYDDEDDNEEEEEEEEDSSPKEERSREELIKLLEYRDKVIQKMKSKYEKYTEIESDVESSSSSTSTSQGDTETSQEEISCNSDDDDDD